MGRVEDATAAAASAQEDGDVDSGVVGGRGGATPLPPLAPPVATPLQRRLAVAVVTLVLALSLVACLLMLSAAIERGSEDEDGGVEGWLRHGLHMNAPPIAVAATLASLLAASRLVIAPYAFLLRIMGALFQPPIALCLALIGTATAAVPPFALARATLRAPAVR